MFNTNLQKIFDETKFVIHSCVSLLSLKYFDSDFDHSWAVVATCDNNVQDNNITRDALGRVIKVFVMTRSR